MKKIYSKLLTLFMGIIALLLLPPINTAKAAVVYSEYHPQDLIDDASLYDEVIALTIEGDEINSISQIDLSRITNLKEIILFNTAVLDGSILDMERTIDKVIINNSIVNISTFDLNDFDSIDLNYSYIIGDKIENLKIHNSEPLNEEYKLELNDIYGLQNYESQIDMIAEIIYNQSDGTPEDIIRLVTLYVIEHMEYDSEKTYVGLPYYESIIDHEKGVCAHYANFESRLLNKLGIFSLDVAGCTNPNDCMNNNHAWNIIYVNEVWYSIDPTWLDNENSILALKNSGFGSVANTDDEVDEFNNWLSSPLKDYMQDINNPYFNLNHQSFFTSFNLIPESERVSKMSIIPNANKSDSEYTNEDIAKNDNNDTKIKAPDTGLFTPSNESATISIIIIKIVILFATTSLVLILINRITKKMKIRNF